MLPSQERAAAPPAPAAPAALALCVTADLFSTLSMVSLACVASGPLAAALLLRTPDARLNAAGSLADLLLAALLRAAAALGHVSCGARCAASGAGAAAAGAVHAAAAAWLVAKGALAVGLLDGGLSWGARLAAGGVELRVPALLAAEALGVLFSGLLLAQAVGFRRVLQQRAPRDALSALCPLRPDAREWLEQRQSLVREWVEAAAPLGSPQAGSPAQPRQRLEAQSPPPARPKGAWRKAAAAVAAAPAAVAAAVAKPAARRGATAPLLPTHAAAAPRTAAQERRQPLLAGVGDVWGSDAGSDAMHSAASHAGAASSMAASFCTAASD
ncbi:MAG: hypothetical protein J3K34DRAFT_458020 [Monoraphidium minutum]|nr:MAG: hypothetical protein J3K34DRAFT_458020 [Monoraphidium minutum]